MKYDRFNKLPITILYKNYQSEAEKHVSDIIERELDNSLERIIPSLRKDGVYADWSRYNPHAVLTQKNIGLFQFITQKWQFYCISARI